MLWLNLETVFLYNLFTLILNGQARALVFYELSNYLIEKYFGIV